MNENKLLACKIKPYTIELDEGQIVKVTNEVWVGYWNRSGEFSAVCWDRLEDGRLVGGDSVTVTKEEFVEKVEKVIDIFGDTESYNVRYLLSLSQTQIADYDKRIAELEKENAELKMQLEEWKKCFLSCSSPFCSKHFPTVESSGVLGNMEKKEK